MFLHERTVTVKINNVEVSFDLCNALKAYFDRHRTRFRKSEKKAEKDFRRKIYPKPFHPKFFSALRIDSGLVAHGHLRPQVTSPPKVEGSILGEGGKEKRRSPGPLPPDVPPSAQIVALSPESTSQQTVQWLRKNSFGSYVSTFANFNGADILRLTRDDLIQICGLADGIRLLYALHSKAIVRLTLYICIPSSAVYHAVYLDHVGRNEMYRKLTALLGIHQSQIHDLYLQGPNDIRVLVSDEVVCNIKDESMFSLEVLKDEARGRFVLLLKPAAPST